MAQWADYGLWKVEYDHRTHRIVKAAVVPNPYYTARSEEQEMSREEIVAALREGKTFVALRKHGNMWHKGASVFLMEVNGEDYIRMHKTEVAMDSRDGLEEF